MSWIDLVSQLSVLAAVLAQLKKVMIMVYSHSFDDVLPLHNSQPWKLGKCKITTIPSSFQPEKRNKIELCAPLWQDNDIWHSKCQCLKIPSFYVTNGWMNYYYLITSPPTNLPWWKQITFMFPFLMWFDLFYFHSTCAVYIIWREEKNFKSKHTCPSETCIYQQHT